MEHESFVRTPRECCAVIEARLGRERTEALRRVDGGYTHFPTLDALPEDTARAVAAYGRRCAYCQTADLASLAIGIDFLVPRERGGSIQAMNLVAACERCRTARRGRHLDAFLASWPSRPRRARRLRSDRGRERDVPRCDDAPDPRRGNGLKVRHQRDLVWRFQYAAEALAEAACAFGTTPGFVPSGASDACAGETLVFVRERAEQIDAALGRLRAKPVSLARVLLLRYGEDEAPRAIRRLLGENAAIGLLALQAVAAFAADQGRSPRPRSHDVARWLVTVAHRIEQRGACREDIVAVDAIRRGAAALVVEAEDAYEAVREAGEGRATIGEQR